MLRFLLRYVTLIFTPCFIDISCRQLFFADASLLIFVIKYTHIFTLLPLADMLLPLSMPCHFHVGSYSPLC